MRQVSMFERLSSDLVQRGQGLKAYGESVKSDTQKQDAKGSSFADHLKEGIQNVDKLSKEADKMAVDVSTGKSDSLHETMIALTKAELSFNMMVQVRNKALEAYQEIMRMPV